jgi:predicted RNase H-like HicB family nuclease
MPSLYAMQASAQEEPGSGLRARTKHALALREQHTRGAFTVTCPKLPPVVTYGETLEEAQANAREAIGLCLEAMREDGQPIPPPDRDLASPIGQLVAVADGDA